MSGKLKRQVILYPTESGCWIADCPSLPGCVCQGKSREEVLVDIKDAIQGHIAKLEKSGQPIPEEPFEVLWKSLTTMV